MLLRSFLIGRTLDAVETLPDDRLINVVVDSGEVYGVVVDNIPLNAQVARRSPVVQNGDVLEVDGLTFDTTQYTMLG